MSGFWKINGAAWRHLGAEIIIGGGKEVLGVFWFEEVPFLDIPGLDVEDTDEVVGDGSASDASLSDWEPRSVDEM